METRVCAHTHTHPRGQERGAGRGWEWAPCGLGVTSVCFLIYLLSWSCGDIYRLKAGGGTARRFLSSGAEQVLPCVAAQLSGWQRSEGSSLSPCRVEQIGLNATNTFLVYTEEDLGDLLKIKLTWEGTSRSWYDLWREFRSYLSQPHRPERELSIRRIRVKSGETQRR